MSKNNAYAYITMVILFHLKRIKYYYIIVPIYICYNIRVYGTFRAYIYSFLFKYFIRFYRTASCIYIIYIYLYIYVVFSHSCEFF